MGVRHGGGGGMTLLEYADVIEARLVIRYRNGSTPAMRWYAYFDHAEVKERSMLVWMYGNGPTPDEAVADYAKQIAGQRLVFDAMGPGRKEFTVPTTLVTVEVQS